MLTHAVYLVGSDSEPLLLGRSSAPCPVGEVHHVERTGQDGKRRVYAQRPPGFKGRYVVEDLDTVERIGFAPAGCAAECLSWEEHLLVCA